MRMAAVALAGVVRVPRLESPHVVTEVDAIEEVGLGQFGQVPVDGGPVETPGGKGRRDLGMRPRCRRCLEVFEDRQSSRGAAESGSADASAGRVGLDSPLGAPFLKSTSPRPRRAPRSTRP